MPKTIRFLTFVMMGAFLALASPAFAASASYTIHGGVVQGNAQAGPERMAGSIPVANMARSAYSSRYNRRWGAPTAFQRRYSGGSNYSGLNQ